LQCLRQRILGSRRVTPFYSSALLLLVSPTWASPAPQTPHPVITDISVAEQAHGIDVEVTFSKVVHAEVSTVEHPNRLVFDFPGCELARLGQRLVVNRGPVLAVRAAAFSVAPLVARVVIDLESFPDHEESYTENRLVIHLSSTGGARDSAPGRGENKGPADGQPVDSGPDRTAHNPPDGALHGLGAQPPTVGTPRATIQVTAYTLLAKARALTVSDLEPLEAKAQAGDPESETTLGLAYHAGTLVKQDDAEARRLLQSAANRGFMAAEQAMGIFSQSGFGMPPDKDQAVIWYTKAAQDGSSDAATSVALMYSTGDGIQKDEAKAVAWFRRAAEAGDATAELNLFALYRRGEGVPRDDAQAVFWLTKAAAQGLLPGMLELARWEMEPEHGRNVDAATGWFKKAADLGDASAQATLGDIFVDQKLGRLDYGQAVLWYQRAADQGLREGQFGLGSRYLLGQGVAQDLEEAKRWLTPAADQGHPYAQLLLANMFEAGQGGPVDVAAAKKYYEPAANYGVAQAQYHLGLLLARDRSSESSLVSAYKWLVLAQDSVKEGAAPAEELRKRLTPPELTQAEREIDDWRTAQLARHSNR